MKYEYDLMSDNIQPSRWYFLLAVLIAVAGFATFGWFIISGVSELGGGLTQMVAPGSAILNLSEAGEYTIFIESMTTVNGKFYRTGEQVPGLQIHVTESSSGSELAVYPAPANLSYSLGGRFGRSIMAFKVLRPGIYRINASYPREEGPEVVLAVGNGLAGAIFKTVFEALAICFGSLIAAAAIALAVYTRRKKALERQKEEERLIRGEA
jgi:hypothetical protein